jgi:hypothetical protein
MSLSLVVVILIASSDAADPATKALTATTQAALGTDAIVVVREVERMPTDDEAVKLEATLGAGSLVEISWPDAKRERAHVHVHVVDASPAWADRDLAFTVADAPRERGRTVGYTVAAMLPSPAEAEAAATITVPAAPAAPAEPATPKAAVAVVAPPPAPPAPVPAPVLASDPAPPVIDVANAPRRRAARFALDVSSIGSFGLGGDAGGAGGELAGRFSFAPHVWAYAAGSATFGRLTSGISSNVERLGAGLLWQPLAGDGAFDVGVGAALIATRVGLVRDSVSMRGERWLSAAELRLEGVWWWTRPLGLVASATGELGFGRTEVTADGAKAATIPLVRGLFAVGLRARF